MQRVHPLLLLSVALPVGLALVTAVPPAAAQECSTSVRPPISWQIVPAIPCPDRLVSLRFETCGPCVRLIGYDPVASPLRVYASMFMGGCIARVCELESLVVPLGRFAAGHHQILVAIETQFVFPDSTWCISTTVDTVRFDVPRDCVPQDVLPYVDTIEFGRRPCPECPPVACPRDSILLHVGGFLPSTCYEFRRLAPLPVPYPGPDPGPTPWGIVIAVNDCPGIPCAEVPVRWDGYAMMPPLPSGAYGMPLQLAEVSACDPTETPLRLYHSRVAFQVAERCSLPQPDRCFLWSWRGDHTRSRCDATVGPGRPATLTFQLLTPTSLAGLQGGFVLDPPALRVTGLRPVGPASDMRLAWEATRDGARFVLFSERGAPIPGCPPEVGAVCVPSPVLELTVEARPEAPVPSVTRVVPVELLASDGVGGRVPECVIYTLEDRAAYVCDERECDVSLDGATDVRDLVVMVRCLNNVGDCPDSTSQGPDCNRDGTYSLDDVLCCARVILSGSMPDTGAGTPAPGVDVTFGVPLTTPAGVDVPLCVRRADLVGAARLAFAWPSDCFEVAGVEVTGDASDWLALHQVEGEALVVGVIGLGRGGPVLPPEDLDLMLHLTLAPGRSPAGELSLRSADFAGHDGGRLLASVGPRSVRVGSASELELSPAQPNPFALETSFRLSLARAADVELVVHDLAGRRVATLHDGRLEVGPHTFRWHGTGADGKRVANGVYFYRATGLGLSLVRRLVLLD